MLALKRLLRGCKKHGEVNLYLDIHGHSILKNSFLFGPTEEQFKDDNWKILPEVLDSVSDLFSMEDCTMSCDLRRIETSRVYFQMKENVFAMTCENSLGLFTDRLGGTRQYTTVEWRRFGVDLLKALIIVSESYSLSDKRDRFPFPRHLTDQLTERVTEMLSTSSPTSKRIDEDDIFKWEKAKT